MISLRGDITSRYFWQSPAVGAPRRLFPDPTLEAIRITPEENRVEVGQTIQLTATGTFDDGTERDVTTDVDWRTSLFTTATVSGGAVNGHKEGHVVIEAYDGEVAGSVDVTVIPASAATVYLESCDNWSFFCSGHWMPVDTPYITTYSPRFGANGIFFSFRMTLEYKDATITAMEAYDNNNVADASIIAEKIDDRNRPEGNLEVGDTVSPGDLVAFNLSADGVSNTRSEVQFRIEIDNETIIDFLLIM
jgi:hypothetical protein